jgi:hypothetical protein
MHRGTTKDTDELFSDTVDDWEGQIIEPFEDFLHRAFRKSFVIVVVSTSAHCRSAPELCSRVALRTPSTDATESRVATPTSASSDEMLAKGKGKGKISDKSTPSATKHTAEPPRPRNSGTNSKGLSGYEIERNANIARNKALITQLGLDDAASTIQKPKEKRQRKKAEPVLEDQLRRGRSSKNKNTM